MVEEAWIKGINSDAEKEWEFVRDMPVDENGLTNEYHGVSKQKERFL